MKSYYPNQVKRKKVTHGGARKGAGRKPAGNPSLVPVTFKLYVDDVAWLRLTGKVHGLSMGKVINRLIGGANYEILEGG